MVAIILYGSFELAPYAKLYMNILDDLKTEYHLIGWKRETQTTYTGDNVYVYNGKTAKRFSNIFKKIGPSLGYRRFVKKLIKKNKYDKIVVLTTQTAVILADVLLGKYKGKYIFDYRDKSYEYIKPYGFLVNLFVKNSIETAISSPWFKNNLTPKKDYILVHNFQSGFLKYKNSECLKKPYGKKIIVGYVGALRAFDYHKSLIDIFADDERFEFYTYGCGDDTETLKQYAEGFKNIYVCGAYNESDKSAIIDAFDMMIYNYPYSYVNDGAVANKYYDSLIMKKPMIVNTETVLGKFIADNGLGVGIDINDKFCADKIYLWYNSFDAKKFAENCEKDIETYIADNQKFVQRMKKALTDNNLR